MLFLTLFSSFQDLKTVAPNYNPWYKKYTMSDKGYIENQSFSEVTQKGCFSFRYMHLIYLKPGDILKSGSGSIYLGMPDNLILTEVSNCT